MQTNWDIRLRCAVDYCVNDVRGFDQAAMRNEARNSGWVKRRAKWLCPAHKNEEPR